MLNDEELDLALRSRYLTGVHAVVATPDVALALANLPDSPLSFQVVDETSRQSPPQTEQRQPQQPPLLLLTVCIYELQ